jgi:hypothetical protein
MAPGPAPKDPSQRRRRNAPARGEWVDLPELDKPVLPDLPEGDWSKRTEDAWSRWRSDPATTQYSPAAISQAINLLYLYEGWVRGDEKYSEVRLTMDGLGLTPKGKRDLRWRAPEEVKEEPARTRPSSTSRVRIATKS